MATSSVAPSNEDTGAVNSGSENDQPIQVEETAETKDSEVVPVTEQAPSENIPMTECENYHNGTLVSKIVKWKS